MYKFVAKDGGKYLTYEEAANAKEKVSKWAETMQSSWETRDLVEQIQKISIPDGTFTFNFLQIKSVAHSAISR